MSLFLANLIVLGFLRLYSDNFLFGSLGLDGDLKKAMKDGKPVIIEVHSHVPMLSNSMSYISIFLKILVSFLTLMQIWLIMVVEKSLEL